MSFPGAGSGLRRGDWPQLYEALELALEADGPIRHPDLAQLAADGLADLGASGLVTVDERVVGALIGATRPGGPARIDTLALAPADRNRGYAEPVIAAWTAANAGAGARFETADGPLAALFGRLGYARLRTLHSLRAALRHAPTAGEPMAWPGHDAPMHRDDWTIRHAPGVTVARWQDTVVAWRGGRLYGVVGELDPRAVRRALRGMPAGDALCVDVPDGALLDALQGAGWIRFATRGEWAREPTRR